MRLIRVFPRRTKATPVDDLAYCGPPDLFAEGDAVHIDVNFTWDKPYAEQLAEDWRHVAPVTLGGVAYGDPGAEFVPGRYIKAGYTFTSRGCPRRCWFSVTGDTAIHTARGGDTSGPWRYLSPAGFGGEYLHRLQPQSGKPGDYVRTGELLRPGDVVSRCLYGHRLFVAERGKGKRQNAIAHRSS